MGYWTKYFSDGTKYIGDDIAIQKKEASWSKSRLSNFVGVDLCHDNYMIKIVGYGDYWQSDTYEIGVGINGSCMVKRRIEKKINSHDTSFRYSCTPDKYFVSFFPGSDTHIGIPNPAPQLWIDKWFILERDLQTKQTVFYIKDSQI
jgi:hypothetical protein